MGVVAGDVDGLVVRSAKSIHHPVVSTGVGGDMGRFLQNRESFFSLDGRFADDVVSELDRRAQLIRMLPDWDDNMGHAQAIRIDPDSGLLEGGVDPRGDGAALGR